MPYLGISSTFCKRTGSKLGNWLNMYNCAIQVTLNWKCVHSAFPLKYTAQINLSFFYERCSDQYGKNQEESLCLPPYGASTNTEYNVACHNFFSHGFYMNSSWIALQINVQYIKHRTYFLKVSLILQQVWHHSSLLLSCSPPISLMKPWPSDTTIRRL